MLIKEMVHLIEKQADELAELMVDKIRQSPRMAAYHRFGDNELAERARLVYANLGKWLEASSEGLLEEEYFNLGTKRHGERVPLSQVIWALLLIRRNLWHFIESQGWDTVSDLQRSLDLEILVVRFFDRAILHTVRGYESAGDGPGVKPLSEEASFWPGG